MSIFSLVIHFLLHLLPLLLLFLFFIIFLQLSLALRQKCSLAHELCDTLIIRVANLFLNIKISGVSSLWFFRNICLSSLPLAPQNSKILKGYWDLWEEVEGKERVFLGRNRVAWKKLKEGDYNYMVVSEHLISFTATLRASRMVTGHAWPQTGDVHPHQSVLWYQGNSENAHSHQIWKGHEYRKKARLDR